jgi:hypothetical protein
MSRLHTPGDEYPESAYLENGHVWKRVVDRLFLNRFTREKLSRQAGHVLDDEVKRDFGFD